MRSSTGSVSSRCCSDAHHPAAGVEGQQVGVDQVADVHVVADAGSVRGQVVGPDGDRFALPEGA